MMTVDEWVAFDRKWRREIRMYQYLTKYVQVCGTLILISKLW